MKSMLVQVHANKTTANANKEELLGRRVKGRVLRAAQDLKFLKAEEERVSKQLLDSQILYFLRTEPQTLYSIRNELQQTFGVHRSFGTIHPHLARMESMGLIRRYYVRSNRAGFHKVFYKLTNKGEATLERNVALIKKIARKMSA